MSEDFQGFLHQHQSLFNFSVFSVSINKRIHPLNPPYIQHSPLLENNLLKIYFDSALSALAALH